MRPEVWSLDFHSIRDLAIRYDTILDIPGIFFFNYLDVDVGVRVRGWIDAWIRAEINGVDMVQQYNLMYCR